MSRAAELDRLQKEAALMDLPPPGSGNGVGSTGEEEADDNESRADDYVGSVMDTGAATVPAEAYKTQGVEVPKRTAGAAKRGRPAHSAAQVAAMASLPMAALTAAASKTPLGKIARYLPDAETLKVYKVSMGRQSYILTWKAKDILSRSQDIEQMIQQYLVPKYGPGEYCVELYNAKGEIVRTVTTSVEDPNMVPVNPTAAMSPGPTLIDAMMRQAQDQVRMFSDRAEKLDDQLKAMMMSQPSLVDQLQELQEVRKALGGDDDDKAFKIWREMRSEKQSSVPPQLISELAELRASSKSMMDRIQFMVTQPAAAPMSQLPLFPPPPSEPPINIADVMRATIEAANANRLDPAALIQMLRPAQDPEVQALREEVRRLQEKSAADVLREEMREMNRRHEELMREVLNRRSGSGEMKETLTTLQTAVQLIQQAQKKPGEEGTFWGMLQTLVANLPQTAEAVGGLVEKLKIEQGPAQLPPPQTRPAQLAAPAPAPKPAPKPVPKPVPKADGPTLPDGFAGQAMKISSAKDDPERIGAVIESLMFLGQFPQWQPKLLALVKAVQEDRKGDVLDFVRGYLEGLVKRGMVDIDQSRQTQTAFMNSYDQVVEFIKAQVGVESGGSSSGGGN